MHRIINSLKRRSFWIPFAIFMVTMMSLRAAEVNYFIALAASLAVEVAAIVGVAFFDGVRDAKKREKGFEVREGGTVG